MGLIFIVEMIADRGARLPGIAKVLNPWVAGASWPGAARAAWPGIDAESPSEIASSSSSSSSSSAVIIGASASFELTTVGRHRLGSSER